MSLLGDAESPKVAFESVELKDNNENGKVLEVGKEEPGEKCRRLFRENKVLVFLICLIIIGIAIGIGLGFIIGKEKTARIVRAVPIGYRLPNDIVPIHYVLEVQPYIIPNNFTFEGKVKVLVTCVSETDKVILHSKNLTIINQDVKALTSSDDKIEVSDVEYEEKMDFLILHLSENMKEGKDYMIFLSYSGLLQKEGKGFYVSSYLDENLDKHYVASTQYEAIHAREGFPCFDEPALKATFEITLVRWGNMSSLSNMPRIKTERRGNDWVADTFLTTLKMSTYIVAYYFGEYVGKVDKKVRVWAPKHQAEFVDFSLDLANKLLPFYEEQFGITYAPPKLDMIPVTELVAAAMENWGLIIYVNDELLYNKTERSLEAKQSIAVTVAHELAHQWFGNLVTPRWWSDVWLSEGMTTYMESLATKHFFPEWSEVDKTITTLYLGIYEEDCANEKPLAVWNNISGEELSISGEAFGSITYMKGAMIGRMMHYILGDDNFWRGIRTYLKDYSYGNVEEKDLLKHLTEAQLGNKKIDMQEAMWTWTHLSGAPIVTVTRDYKKRTAVLSQRSCKTKNVEFFSSDLWHVPISYTTPRNPEINPEIQAWLTGNEMRIKDLPKDDEWILVNGQSIGYYLVNYDRKNWELLAEQLRNNHKVFSADQRYKILADANMLYTLDDISIEVILDLSSYLANEKILTVFSYPITNVLTQHFMDMKMSAYYDYWSEFVLPIIIPIQTILGWEINPQEHLQLSNYLLLHSVFMLCELDYQPCVDFAVTRFNELVKTDEGQILLKSLSSNPIMCTAVRSGSKEILDYLVSQNEGDDNLQLMACSKNDTIIQYVFGVFQNGWYGKYASVINKLMNNRMHWMNFLNFLDIYLTISEEENVYIWLREVGKNVASKEQKEKFRKLVERHIDRIPEKHRQEVDEHVKQWESEKEAKVNAIGEWLIGKIWAK